MLQRGLAILLSVCMLTGGISDTAYAMSPQAAGETLSAAQDISVGDQMLPTEDTTGVPIAESGEQSAEGQTENEGSSEGISDGTESDNKEDETDGAETGSTEEDNTSADDNVTGDETNSDDVPAEDVAGGTEDDGRNDTEEDDTTAESGGGDAVGIDSTSNIFTVNAEESEVSELTVTKNGEGNYTLQSEAYQLNLILTPSYRTVAIAMELRHADGSVLTGNDSYYVYYQTSYDAPSGNKINSSIPHEMYFFSSNNYIGETCWYLGIASGGEFLITELQICDSSNRTLAMLGASNQAIAVNTLTMDKQGVLVQVTAEDSYIMVQPEVMIDNNVYLRYRKKEEGEWTYQGKVSGDDFRFMLAAEPDTDYVVELVAIDRETVYDTVEVRTKAFAASDIKTEVTNITSSSATIKVTVGSYTGSNQKIYAWVSYVDGMGKTQMSRGYIYADAIATDSINLTLSNLVAGMEYNDLEVKLDDTDLFYSQYVAYKTKVSFITTAPTLTEEQINVTVTPDTMDATKAVLRVALQGVTEGSYSYKAQYRVAGSKDWQESITVSGILASNNSYVAEQNLTSLIGDTEYEAVIAVGGITKTVSFTTASTAVAVKVEVQPLMMGVRVNVALTGDLSGEYYISTYYYSDGWCTGWLESDDGGYSDSADLTADNHWETTAVFGGWDVRPNWENDWKIVVGKRGEGKIYEKYITLKAVEQEIFLIVNRGYTVAQIRGVRETLDESEPYIDHEYIYYRVKGTVQWVWGGDFYDSGSDKDDIRYFLTGLKEDTEYEVKLVPMGYPEIILAQTTFRTLKDTGSLSVSVDHCLYTSANVKWVFDNGESASDISGTVWIYYRKKGMTKWEESDFWPINWTNSREQQLSDLEPGTTYEVLVQLKDNDYALSDYRVVKEVTTEFTTASVDHLLKAQPVEAETTATSVALDLQLEKSTGTLEDRAKADVTLVSSDGDTQTETVYLSKENNYKTKLIVSNLLPQTKYTVSAELYESEDNTWVFLKHFDLGEVTTAEAEALTSLTISEQELTLNRGTSKKLTVTVQPQTAADSLKWTSSDETVATVSRDGTVTAYKAGAAEITVSALGGGEAAPAVCHVTVRDYEIRVRNEDGSYGSMPNLLSKAQKHTMVVYDGATGQELTGVTWSSSNPNAAKISDGGLLEPQNYGQAYITAATEDGIVMKLGPIKVVNEIQGFSITRPETDNGAYPAVRTAEAVYQVAAGETYRVGCVLSPAYTDQYVSSVSIAGDSFTWASDHDAVTVKVSEADPDLTEITIPAAVSGTVKISAVMKDEAYRDKSFTITLDVLKKPEVTILPDTYTWLDYSSKLRDVGLPENWQWKEQDTLLYETGTQTFTARYVQSGYYPYETGVTVHAEKIGNNLSVIGNYSTSKKAYVVKKETPLQISVNALGGSMPALLYEQAALTAAAKDAEKISISTPDEAGYCAVTASAKGTYTVSAAVSIRKAAFEKAGGTYVLTAGAKVKDVTETVKFMAVDAAPIQTITFAVAADSPEKVTFTEDGTIEYEITAANADTKNTERVIYIDVTAKDTDNNVVESPSINYAVSDAAVVKQKKDGTNRLILTIPKGADGLAKVVATAKDELGSSAQFAVRVKDYTPRVTTSAITINENYSSGTMKGGLAKIVLPYDEEENDAIEKLSLVETNTNGGTDEVAGLEIAWFQYSPSVGYAYRVDLGVKDKTAIKNKGNLNYYLAIATKAYGGTIFVPVKIKITTGLPTVSLKQSGKVNVFYTDTTHLADYDAVSMGTVELSTDESIESVRWVAGDGGESAGNTEFIIGSYYSSVWKNGKATRKYMIQQNKPILDSAKKPSEAATKGNIYVRLYGYKEELKLPFTIQTAYKKPKLKAADYKVCPTLGETADYQSIYTNAAKTNNDLIKGSSSVWRGYSDVVSADEEIEIVPNSNVSLHYNGTKDKKTQLTFYSDYWCEALTVPVKVKVAKSKVKLSPATITLNTAYPSETTQTMATTFVYNTATGSVVYLTDVGIEGANAQAQQILDQSLINIEHSGIHLAISLNYANAMGTSQIKPGSYKYKLTPYYRDTQLNSVTLSVKVIDKEATAKVKTKGAIDLLKLNWDGYDYDLSSNNYITVTPTFKNLNSSYMVLGAELGGAYKDLFVIGDCSLNGTLKVMPASVGKLKAGKSYQLSVRYTVRDASGEGGEQIVVQSNTFTVKPKQSAPKVTTSEKQLSLYACAKGRGKAEKMYLYVPHEYKKGYYAIQNASGSLDVNKDGKADLIVETLSTTRSSGTAQIAVYVQDADAIRATAKGVTYKIPVTVSCVGRDGVSKDTIVKVSVVVKK